MGHLGSLSLSEDVPGSRLLVGANFALLMRLLMHSLCIQDDILSFENPWL